MAIIRWDPFREMTQVQNQFNRLVDQVWNNRQESWLPAVDVFDRKDAVVLKAELAGMDPDDIEIEVEDNVLTIKGERKFEEQVEDERYYRVERRFGSFQRSLALPQGVKANEIQAGYEDGILTSPWRGCASLPEEVYRISCLLAIIWQCCAGVTQLRVQYGCSDTRFPSCRACPLARASKPLSRCGSPRSTRRRRRSPASGRL